MNKSRMKKGLALVLTLVMVFATTASVFAADAGKVSVSITGGNFDTNGNYVGGGTPLTTVLIPVTDHQITLDDLSNYVGDEFALKETFYLPSDATDPLPGQASVLDAVLATLLENGYDDINAGWSSYSDPEKGIYPGGYINDFGGTNVSNNVTYENRDDGYIWGHSKGFGWNIAYKPAGGTFQTTYNGQSLYMSSVPVSSGMDIIIDLSEYDMEWNTYKQW